MCETQCETELKVYLTVTSTGHELACSSTSQDGFLTSLCRFNVETHSKRYRTAAVVSNLSVFAGHVSEVGARKFNNKCKSTNNFKIIATSCIK